MRPLRIASSDPPPLTDQRAGSARCSGCLLDGVGFWDSFAIDVCRLRSWRRRRSCDFANRRVFRPATNPWCDEALILRPCRDRVAVIAGRTGTVAPGRTLNFPALEGKLNSANPTNSGIGMQQTPLGACWDLCVGRRHRLAWRPSFTGLTRASNLRHGAGRHGGSRGRGARGLRRG